MATGGYSGPEAAVGCLRNQVRFNAPCLAHIKSGFSLGKPLFSQWCASGHQEYLTLVSSVRRIPG
ncbi:hypothetical protein CFBP6411_01026 [Pseudomonas syringae group genomosp. 3]|uniref:Uncharacterized protein n=1 Tax=Pseudomonas syringae group genomosp. 3 TaxID=251701 RepID=A0A2K4W923_9PSED|nr:hypothetical protein CFBP6411_01026 [Pseudomonas syringae group genomosp. 3]